ncbi:MAG: DUF3592 domain-containing protein [Anaerolineales bacterium]|nr:DUF3592 domain-containing protein [Anaerolineales bacterium]
MEIFTIIFTGITLLLSIGGAACAVILPILILGGLGYFLYKRNQKSTAYRQSAQNWLSTTGTILMSSVQSRRSSSSGGYSDYPVIVYQYQVNGQSYQSQRLKAGEQFFNVNVSWQAQETINKYPIGKEVTVYYDPNNPAESALER